LPRQQWDRLDGLETDGLECVYRYFDAQTDDARLTLAVMNSAIGLGAELAMPAEFVHAEITRDEVRVHYRSAGREHECAARALVNAAGPWAPRVSARISPLPAIPPLDLVQGTHMIVRGDVHRGVYYVESPADGRAVFVIPWQGAVMVGTTETPYTGEPDAVRPLPGELEYLREVLLHYFPAYRAPGACTVLGSFAGLRVLPASTAAAFHRRRETLLEVDDPRRPRLLAIYGGKLTGWRATSERVLERLAVSLPSRTRRADTRRLRIEPP
jgi:glycerol-3-phosphate dehydrogenase